MRCCRFRRVSWITRTVEQRLANAAEAGELHAGPLQGKPIPGIDQRRPEGWWAEQFVRRERSHDRRKPAQAAMDRAQARFWRAESSDEVRMLVAAANRAITEANLNLVDGDRLALFDAVDVIGRWRALQR